MQKILIFLLIIGVFVVTACSASDFKADTNYDIQAFSYTDQHDQKVSLKDLQGQPWLAMFMFTNCTTVCPPMTGNMADIQTALIDANITNYKIVGFTVDPQKDTPQVLNNYLAKFNVADDSKWYLLTGYPFEEIEKLAYDSFHQLVKDDPNSDQFIHSSTFSLVNSEGKVVKSYDGFSDVPIDDIVADIKALNK